MFRFRKIVWFILLGFRWFFGFNFIGPRNRTHLIRLFTSVQKQMETINFHVLAHQWPYSVIFWKNALTPAYTKQMVNFRKHADLNNIDSQKMQVNPVKLTGHNWGVTKVFWLNLENLNRKVSICDLFGLICYHFQISLEKTKTGISIWPSERPWNEKLFDTNSHAIFGIHKVGLPRNDLKDFGEDYNKDEVVELRMRIP